MDFVWTEAPVAFVAGRCGARDHLRGGRGARLCAGGVVLALVDQFQMATPVESTLRLVDNL